MLTEAVAEKSLDGRPCPSCGSQETTAAGQVDGNTQMICRVCGFKWRVGSFIIWSEAGEDSDMLDMLPMMDGGRTIYYSPQLPRRFIRDA